MLRSRKRSGGFSAFPWLALVFLSAAACERAADGLLISSSPPYDLTFSLDASFQAPHGGQPVAWAVVRTDDGAVVARGNGTISATKNPSFSFKQFDLLERKTDYEVHYWIDSNIGGGTLGVCDPKAIDHQWSVEFLAPVNDIDFTTSYQPALTEDVCSTFP